MGKGKRLLRRAALGALVAGVVLAFAVPSIALASVASFSSKVPTPGSSSTNTKPTISVKVYDRYGVRYMTNMRMYIDTVRVTPTWARIGSGFTRFKLSYKVSTALSAGSHTVRVWVKDRAGHISSTSWSFTVLPTDTTPPTTLSNAVASYAGPATILLFASDAGGSGVAHTYSILDGGPVVAGTAAFTAGLGSHTLEFWSVDNAGNVEGHHTVGFTVTAPMFAHAAPANSCTAVGCHGGLDLASIHWASKCTPCHAPGVTPAHDCTLSRCHGELVHAAHKVISSSSTPACTQATCHGTNVVTIHVNCAQCHASTDPTVVAAIAAGGATCETCHTSTAVAHAAIGTSHAVSGSCYTALCHKFTDVGDIHTLGDDPPGCAACHATPAPHTIVCGTVGCHPDLAVFHDHTHANASGTTDTVDPTIGPKSAACTACHGTDLVIAHNGVFTSQPDLGCFCHTNRFFDMTGEMAPLLAAGRAECIDCHNGAHAAHGFTNGVSHGSGYVAASGHNTTTYGRVGARTDFSSLGVIDTVGNAPSAQFPLSVNNTFKAGYSWTSTVTCEDCHTALTGNEAAGPHGGQTFANWGIDPAYSGSFETASLWGGQYDQKVSGGATVTIGPFAEGIAQWTPAGGESEELKDYQVYTPNMSTPTTTSLVAGPASVTAGDLICVKCHDLYDATKATGFKGWANYAHEHHSADTGSFKMVFGKYRVEVDGANAATYTVAAESMAAAKTAVTTDHGGSVVASSQVIAASLGREVAGACRNCHIAIPHGWKRPKLIVYSNLPDPTPGWRAAKKLPATGDSAPYNIGPAVYENEGLAGTNIGSGQMNGLASGPVHFQEATHLLPAFGGLVATIGSDPAQLLIEDFDFPSLYEATAGNGDEYVNWSSAQCNACGHHSATSFDNASATQPAMSWNSRESNWTSTKPANGAWK
jgi:hypothetical protein